MVNSLKGVFHSAINSDQTNFSDRKFILGFLVHFPFGARVIFSFGFFGCFSNVELIMEG